ncbi:MAG: hypothetical protein HQL90_13295 [Magnetococcales bacterium]|nr:hypothetical protein [Magnetococcales bacterium]
MRLIYSSRCRRWHLLFAVASCWLLLLAGCGPTDGAQTHVASELAAGDTVVQTLRRLFFPASYWKEKGEQLQGDVRKQQEAFNERTQAYHKLLEQRRARVNAAIAEAEANGKGADEARRLVIQEFRVTLDPLREEARQLGKELRRLMTLQAQAEAAARGGGGK